MSILLENYQDGPIDLLNAWLSEAAKTELNDPTAAALATATPSGQPSVRMVLVKNSDQTGVSFYSNAMSRKGQELKVNPLAALCFHWKSLRRQVRVEGPVSELPPETADHYFHSRSRGSQIAAAVSKQSHVLESRERLLQEVVDFSARFEGQQIPRPPDWRGYVLQPRLMEFWLDGPDRLHDRVLFEQTLEGWTRRRLYP